MIYLEYILFIYIAFCVLYALIFSLAGNFNLKNQKEESSLNLNKIVVLIPAYKEDSVIISVAQKALEQNYPSKLFNIVVIGDKLLPETILSLKNLPIEFYEVKFEKSTKTRALNYFFKHNKRNYGIAVILDADNIMEPDFLQKVNQKFEAQNKVIQTRRVAKNMNTSFAILDALSEIINNHIFRKGHYSLGFSCSLIGSGMAFDFNLLQRTMLEMDAIGGFDRELEYRLLEKGYKAVYLENAVVYDEKVDKAENFSNQRKRWISSQFSYLKQYLVKGTLGLFKGNISYFNSSVLRNLMLPRVIILGFLFVIAIVAFTFQDFFTLSWKLWAGVFFLNLLTLIIAVPISFYNKRFFQSLLYIPQAFWIMFMLLFKLRGANKTFIHTPHSETDVSNKSFVKNGKR